MQTMYSGVVSSPSTALTNAIDNIQTTIIVNDASKLPNAPNLAVIGLGEDAETILYTGKSGNSIIGVTRGFQGATKSWNIGVNVARFFTEYDFAAFKANILENANNLSTHMADSVAHVQLYNGTDSTNTTLGATANAVKTAMDRANQAFQQANDGKTAVANAVTAKGVSASSTDTFGTLATKIGQIVTGKRFATGRETKGYGKYVINTLQFRPSIIIVKEEYYTSSNTVWYRMLSYDVGRMLPWLGRGVEFHKGSTTNVENECACKVNTSVVWTINNVGFTLEVDKKYINNGIEWLALE